MSTEKPKTQLVSQGRYVWVLTGKTILESVSLLLHTSGVILVPPTVILMVIMPIAGLFLGLFAAGLMAIAFHLSKTTKSINSVTPMTPHIFRLLPLEQTLVRAAEAPPSEQQAELLRPAGQGSETPSAQLLRAAQDCGQNV